MEKESVKEERISFIKFIPGIAWFFVVAFLTMLPGKDVPEVGWLNIPNFDKFVHACLFGGLTLLFCLPYFTAHFSFQLKINAFLRIALALAVWGVAIEVIQKSFIPGRSFEWIDVIADCTGIGIAFWMAIRIIKSSRYKKYNK